MSDEEASANPPSPTERLRALRVDEPQPTQFSALPLVLIMLLGTCIVVLLARPCELYRLSVIAKYSEFGITNTVNMGNELGKCACAAADATDPFMVAEGHEPRRMSDDNNEIIPELQF